MFIVCCLAFLKQSRISKYILNTRQTLGSFPPSRPHAYIQWFRSIRYFILDVILGNFGQQRGGVEEVNSGIY